MKHLIRNPDARISGLLGSCVFYGKAYSLTTEAIFFTCVQFLRHQTLTLEVEFEVSQGASCRTPLYCLSAIGIKTKVGQGPLLFSFYVPSSSQIRFQY